MVTEDVSYTIGALYRELLEHVQAEGASSIGEVDDIIDAILEERVNTGNMSDQDNTEQLRDALRLRWEQEQESDNA